MRLELFDVRRRWPRQRTQRDDERGFVNSGILFSLSSSVQFVGLILPSNSHAEIKTRFYASAIFPISGDWDVLLPLIWNGLCKRRRAEITVMQFTGHSLPVHHWSGTFTLSHIISRAHLCDFFRLLAIGICHFRYLRNWQVWSSSSGNNYHAVHRSISSGASLFFKAQWEFLPCLILWAKLYFTYPHRGREFIAFVYLKTASADHKIQLPFSRQLYKDTALLS